GLNDGRGRGHGDTVVTFRCGRDPFNADPIGVIAISQSGDAVFVWTAHFQRTHEFCAMGGLHLGLAGPVCVYSGRDPNPTPSAARSRRELRALDDGTIFSISSVP